MVRSPPPKSHDTFCPPLCEFPITKVWEDFLRSARPHVAETCAVRPGWGSCVQQLSDPNRSESETQIASDCNCNSENRESLNGGLANGGLSNCPRLPTIVVILRRKFRLETGPKGHKCAQLCANCREWP